MADIEFNKDTQIVEIDNAPQEVHFNFARPFIRFNQTTGLYNFDDSPQEVHFDIEGTLEVKDPPAESYE